MQQGNAILAHDYALADQLAPLVVSTAGDFEASAKQALAPRHRAGDAGLLLSRRRLTSRDGGLARPTLPARRDAR